LERNSSVFARFERFTNLYISLHRKETGVDLHSLYVWQAELYTKLRMPGTSREIMFYVDVVGNTGKSWFARYFCTKMKTGQVIIPGKKADMAYMLDEEKKVYFIDCPRSKQGEFIQYDFLEEIKNCYVFSPKYDSRVKKLCLNHLVVLLNE
jgi:hypothetical protein